MNRIQRHLSIAALALVPAAGWAQVATLQFTGVVDYVQPGTPYPPLGSTISGSFVFDYSPAHYATGTNPFAGPNQRDYLYLGPPYGLNASFTQLGAMTRNVALEVFDNGTTAWPETVSGDLLWLASKWLNISYALKLSGPDSSFSGTAIPAPATWQSGWTSAQLDILDLNRGVTTLTAHITNVSVNVVPEPATWAMFASGLLALVARRRRLDRRGG